MARKIMKKKTKKEDPLNPSTLTEQELKKVIDKASENAFKKPKNPILVHPNDTGLFKGAFIGSSIVEDGKRKILTPMDHVKLGRLHHFINMVSTQYGTNAISVPHLTGVVNDEDYTEERFTEVGFKIKDYKVHGSTPGYADMLLYDVISSSTHHLPTIVSPEMSVLEKVVLALEKLNESGQRPDKSALVMDTEVHNDLVISTAEAEAAKYWGNAPLEQYPPRSAAKLGSARNTFLGIPIIEVPTKGTGDIYVINPQVATVFVRESKEIGATLSAGGGLMPDAVVVSSDKNAHVVSKHFDESTNDWCVDCWTCGYSYWAYEEAEADDLLSKHAGNDTRLFYKKVDK